jgi:hypothetical protein
MADKVRNTDVFFQNPVLPVSSRTINDLKTQYKHLKAQDLDREFETIIGIETCLDFESTNGTKDLTRKMAHFAGPKGNREGFIFEADDFIELDAKKKLRILVKKDNAGKNKKTLTILAKTTADQINSLRNEESDIVLTSYTDDHT